MAATANANIFLTSKLGGGACGDSAHCASNGTGHTYLGLNYCRLCFGFEMSKGSVPFDFLSFWLSLYLMSQKAFGRVACSRVLGTRNPSKPFLRHGLLVHFHYSKCLSICVLQCLFQGDMLDNLDRSTGRGGGRPGDICVWSNWRCSPRFWSAIIRH